MNNNINNINVLYKDCIHPLLDNPISNSININYKNNRNLCLTGPNASGKSVFIKSLVLNIILSQSLRLTSCSKLIHNKFDKIFCILNISDDVGVESLFEAQIHRIINIINYENNNPNKKILIVLDEVLNSTNYKV